MPAGATLTIEPGVVVEYAGAYRIYVQGAVVAVGTEEAPVVFRSTMEGVSSGATMLHFEGANLALSQLRDVQFKDAQRAIMVGGNVDVGGQACTGVLNVSRAIVRKSEVRAAGYQTGAELQIEDSVFEDAKVFSRYAYGEPITMTQCALANTIVEADAYSLGITLVDSTVAGGEFWMHCCGAKLTFIGTEVTGANFVSHDVFTGPLTIRESRFVNTPINLPNATVDVVDSEFEYTGAVTPALVSTPWLRIMVSAQPRVCRRS